MNEFNTGYYGRAQARYEGLNSNRKNAGYARSEFTATKDPVTPATVFPQASAVGLRHLHRAAIPLGL
jgi:hypothetical protein